LRLCLGVKKEEEWRKRKMEGIHHLIRERESVLERDWRQNIYE
jgi:hypothetical protein